MIKEKIEKINSLNEELILTSEFLKLLKNSQEITGKSKKINNLHFMSISASICTGEQSIHRDREIYGNVNFMNEIAKKLIPIFEEKIIEIEKNLKYLIK